MVLGMTGLPIGADVVDYRGEWGCERTDKIKNGLLTEDVQSVGGSWVSQDKRTKGWLQGHR